MKGLSTAVVWDLDGTLADNSHRRHLAPADFASSTEDQWAAWSAACGADAPILGSIRRMQMDSEHHQIHVCSSRGMPGYEQTRRWLDQYVPGAVDYLKLREPHDRRPGWELKVEYIRALQQRLRVRLVYEDIKAEADSIYELTGVPVVLVNPAYDWIEVLREQPVAGT